MINDQVHNHRKDISNYFFRASPKDFGKIPGQPFAYWASHGFISSFENQPRLANIAKPMIGMRTGDNERFLRFWQEISKKKFNFSAVDSTAAKSSGAKWFPYNKGGEFRRWYGNNYLVVNWQNNGLEIKEETLRRYPQLSWDNLGWKISNEKFFFRPSVTWTATSSNNFGVRYSSSGFIFDVKGSSAFPDSNNIYAVLGLLASKPAGSVLKMLNPTMENQPRDVGNIPFPLSEPCNEKNQINEDVVPKLISLARSDWDSYETSWDFTKFPLIDPVCRQIILKDAYQNIRAHWREMTLDMQRLEVENNRIFIDAYGLQDELIPDVPLEEITLTCNPYYRYGNNKSEEELEALLLADTMRELVSYAVGCMFGRYALEKPGLVLANQGETIEDYLKQIPEPNFPADDDNVIPMLDGDWFTDDITERFREFLRIAFGEEHYEENLRFVEQALGKDIRKYFLKDFYNDHVRRYKKRPIYWLFSSPKGSFNALIYMHRYQPHTVGTVLEYLRDFKDEKLKARKNHLEAVSISAGASQGEKTKALKEIEKINKILAELDDYERDVLYPLATEQVEIDLDDGVKTNYPKFGEALKKIPGLS